MASPNPLDTVVKPGRYLGHEYNIAKTNWNAAKLKFCLVFPDLYEIGMSHQGLQILYHLINGNKELLAERCYCPDKDMEELLSRQNKPLTSLESEHSLAAFDVIGFTLPYELCYTNILTVLHLAGLPFYSKDRNQDHPLILGGGACSLNPEPVADFFDAILLGDGEEAIFEIAGALLPHGLGVGDRAETLKVLAEIPGIYVPSHYQPQYKSLKAGGELAGIRHLHKKKPVMRRVLPDLDATDHLKHPLVPNAKIVHDRLGIEVARGCTRGCRFCQAGITYRPVRERSPEQIFELAQQGLANSGFEELALLSLSTGDYSCLDQSLFTLMESFAGDRVSVAMPSMRVGTLTPEIMEQIKRVRKTGFTLAPEAGSDRLRQIINKGISEEDLLTTCSQAFALGWRVIKTYFMIGLPGETQADREEIATLAQKILNLEEGKGKGPRRQITVSVGVFVPKPHTPFQWEEQMGIEESATFFRKLKHLLPKKGCKLRYHDPKISFLEGVFSRGDRRLAPLLVKSWQMGARLDGWSEHFNLDLWHQAANACDIELAGYLRARKPDEILPWDHLESGVDRQFLITELQKSKTGEYTPDCRYESCQKCGLCDFTTIRPIVHNRKKIRHQHQAPAVETYELENAQHWYMVHYQKRDKMRFLGHLELLQIIFRALRRAHIPVNYSKGFNPSPKISFGPALAVGTESKAEFFIMDLYRPLEDLKESCKRLNEALPPGLKVYDLTPSGKKTPQNLAISYTARLAEESGDVGDRIADFLAAKSFMVTKIRKNKEKEIDIRPLIGELSQGENGEIDLVLLLEATRPGIKPREALAAIFALSDRQCQAMQLVKNSWQEIKGSR